uniref:DUF2141 domain-containing protein n=1 Tax=Flavobacterium sp. TaxID=239 RepID=UPI004049AFC2
MKTIIQLSIFLLAFVAIAQEVELEIEIQNIASNNGKIYVGVYDSEQNFLSKTYSASQVEIKNQKAICKFKIPTGTYAVSVFHDENDNRKFDTGIFGIPIEDYGTSNDAKGFMGPPKFEDAKFTIDKNQIITISL